MGYTHYFSPNEKAKIIREQYPEIIDEVNNLVNDLYLDLLRNLIFDGQTLEAKFADDKQRDTYFHEYSWDGQKGMSYAKFYEFPKGDVMLFCKTARKRYDIVVKVCFEILERLGLGEASFDGEPESNRVAYMMKELNYDGCEAKIIGMLVSDILLDYDDRVESLCDRIDETEDKSQYYTLSDLSETDLEYVGDQIKEGNWKIYLDRGVVQLSLITNENI